MKINVNADGEVVLSDVFLGVGIETSMGLFGIAQRDDGIEIMLDGKTVWTSHELPGGSERQRRERAPGMASCGAESGPHRCGLASGHQGDHCAAYADERHYWQPEPESGRNVVEPGKLMRVRCKGHYEGRDPCGWSGLKSELKNGCCPACGAGHIVVAPISRPAKCDTCVWVGWSFELRSNGSCPLCKGHVHLIFSDHQNRSAGQPSQRPTWPETWMSIAHTISKRSYDPRLKVGAIIVTSDNTQMLSGGYNGNYAGGPHEHESPEPGKSGFIHAETNALLKLDFNHPKEKHMYITHSPCRACAKLIINAGVRRVVYGIAYRDPSGIDLLNSAGVEAISVDDAVRRAKDAAAYNEGMK